MGKKFYTSKTVWVNLIGILVVVFGADVITPSLTGQILMGINLLLRFATKEPITWS